MVGAILAAAPGPNESSSLALEYMGAPTAALKLQGTACNTSTNVCANAATDPRIQSSIQAQEKKINHDLSPFKFFPQISLGFGINF